MSAYPRPLSDLDGYARAMLNHEGGPVPPLGAEFTIQDDGNGGRWWGWRLWDAITQEHAWWNVPPPPPDPTI